MLMRMDGNGWGGNGLGGNGWDMYGDGGDNVLSKQGMVYIVENVVGGM